MEFKGTKGEWKISTSNEFGVLISTHPMSRDICTIWKYDNNFLENQEAKANAQLIATAHELLEALQQAIKMCDKIQFPTEQELKDFVKLGKQVINQATKIN
jgi:hypothetical protein